MAEIRDSTKSIDFNNLTYNFKGDGSPISFIGFKGPLYIFKSIYNGDISLEDVEKDKKTYKYYKSPEQLNTIKSIKNLYESREKVVQLFNNYAKNMYKNIYKSKQETGLKILIPKQML